MIAVCEFVKEPASQTVRAQSSVTLLEMTHSQIESVKQQQEWSAELGDQSPRSKIIKHRIFGRRSTSLNSLPLARHLSVRGNGDVVSFQLEVVWVHAPTLHNELTPGDIGFDFDFGSRRVR